MQMLGVCVSHETRRRENMGDNTCDMKADRERRWASSSSAVGRGRSTWQETQEISYLLG